MRLRNHIYNCYFKTIVAYSQLIALCVSYVFWLAIALSLTVAVATLNFFQLCQSTLSGLQSFNALYNSTVL